MSSHATKYDICFHLFPSCAFFCFKCLGIAIDCCERMEDIDAIMVIFGTPGLVKIFEVYDVLHQKILECKKPIFPILPSVSTAGPEVQEFLKRGHINFSDEVTLATALTQIMKTPEPARSEVELYGTDISRLHKLISGIKESGYLPPALVRDILSCAGIPLVPEFVSTSKDELTEFAERVGYPVVAKVVGPVHKSDVGTRNGMQHRSAKIFDELDLTDGVTSCCRDSEHSHFLGTVLET